MGSIKMKTLKDILRESISPSGLDKNLNSFRQAAKSGMNGPVGEYTDVLELALDWMSNRVQAGDQDFDQFMQKLKDSGFEPGQPESEPQSIKREPKRKMMANLPDTGEQPGVTSKKTKAEPKQQKEPEKIKEPEKQAEKEPEKKPEEPKKEPSIPSLSSLAGQEMGSDEPEKSKEPEKSDPLKDLPKSFQKDNDSMPSMSSLTPKSKSKKPLSDKEKQALDKMNYKDVDPKDVDTQDWKIGKQVKIGFVKDPFKIVGGDRNKGWVVIDKYGRDYIFYPSKHPKAGRGLRKINTPIKKGKSTV